MPRKLGVPNSAQVTMPSDASPTRRELDILSLLWEMGEASVRDVYERMREHERIAQTTVQTFLRAMEEKGLVKHRVDGRSFIYRARYSQQQSLKAFVDQVFHGATQDLVATLLRTQKLSNTEMKEIEKLIRDMRQKQKRGSG